MPYVQDEDGQWWYVARRYRSRAYARICEACGATFYARRTDPIRFCSAPCGQRRDRHPHWKGSRHVQKGYARVLVDDGHVAAPMRDRAGYVAEHRIVVAEALGRPLERYETVHHINADKTDHRLENLELRVEPHGPGARYRCAACGSFNLKAVPLT
jgi:HNH endonuclease